DHSMRRLLTETGLATVDADGHLVYDPAATNTWAIVLGDNGSYAPVVRAPLNPARAKATGYPTGVWVLAVASRPDVSSPGRTVMKMVNVADLFSLFAGIAGIDVNKAVPPSRILDAKPIMPYLTDPNQPEIRETNFTQYAESLTANGEKSPPCAAQVGPANICAQLFQRQALLEPE